MSYPSFPVLSTTIRQARTMLLSDDLVDFWSEELGLLHRQHQIMARVVARIQETPTAVSLWLQPGRKFSGFEAGQHINLSVQLNGRRFTRSYSPSNDPVKAIGSEPASSVLSGWWPSTGRRKEKASVGTRGSGLIRLTVQTQPEGRVSAHLCTALKVGAIVEISQAFGHFRLPPTDQALLLLAAGSGITPLAALFHAASHRADQTAPVVLLHWSRAGSPPLLGGELAARASALDSLRYQHFSTNAQRNRIRLEQITAAMADLSTAKVLACGPEGFVDSARQLIQPLCRDFAAECFTSGPVPNGAAAEPTDAGPPPDLARPISVTLARQHRTVQLPGHLSLLEGLESLGEQPPHGCRRGICHACSCVKLRGASQDLQSGEMHTETGLIQICRHRPAHGLVLDY